METITESVKDPLLWIGGVLYISIRQAVSNRLTDLERYRANHTYVGLSEAERRAIDELVPLKISLEISWATVSNDDNPRHIRNELLRAYNDHHGHLPSYLSMTMLRVPGNRMLERNSEPAVQLDWSLWHPAIDNTKLHLPPGDTRGVYRIRIGLS